MEILILEGCRGTGKSTLAFKLRQKLPETTLINFTGFHDDGDIGLKKVSNYYDTWMKMFFSMCNHESRFIFDRFYFSEQVYSSLYKNYSFTNEYVKLNNLLEDLSNMNVKVNIVLLTIQNEQELENRLIRDKIPFNKVNENVQESLKQQNVYKHIFNALHYKHANNNLKVHTIDTSGRTNDEVYHLIIDKVDKGR